MVAIIKASSAETTRGSFALSLCSLAAASIASHMLRSLFDAAPSVPSPSRIPSRSIRGTGATPDASFMFDSGLCTEPTPALFQQTDLALVKMNRVRGDDALAEEADAREVFDGRRALLPRDVLDLFARLGDVDDDGRARAVGEGADFFQVLLGDRVGRVRRDGGGDERVALPAC